MSTSETELVNILLEKTEKDEFSWFSITGPEGVNGLLQSYYRCEHDGQRFDLQFEVWSSPFQFWNTTLLIDGWWVSDDSKLLRKLRKPVKQNAERALAAKREQRMQESIRKLKPTG